MTLCKVFLLAIVVSATGLKQSGEEVHCIEKRPHLLRYDVEGEPNDGSSLKGIKNAIVSMEPSPNHAAECDARLRGTPAGDKTFCYGVNQDSTCSSAKADIPLENGKLDCKDCFVAATADLFYKLNYSWNHLNSVEVGLKDMHLRGSVALHSHLEGAVTPFKGSKVLVDNSTRTTIIDKLVGCPVCVKAKITVAVPTSLNYELDVKAQADITAGAELDIDLGDRSIKWDHEAGWTWPEHQRTITVKPILDFGNIQADADVKLGLDTSLQVDLDDIIWYHLNLKPTLPLTCTAKGSLWPIHKAQFCVNGDAALTIGHEADLHWNLLTFKEYHHWGPEQDYSWSRNGIVDQCKDVGAGLEVEATPCCQGKCKEPGMEKYWSIAKSLFGTPHCGESCMNPKDYKLYHFFEANLTKSDVDSPCVSFGYTKYDSTPTHGFGPIKMTLDLYDLPKGSEEMSVVV